jgi:hypothetical protein
VRIAGRVLILAIVIPLVFVASRNRRHRAERAASNNIEDAKLRPRDSTRTLGPGDVRIANVDNSIELALVGDSVITGFGARVLDEVKAKTDTAAVKGSGFAASIEKMVKTTVAGALSHELVFPLRSISDVRYEDGRLQLYDADGSRMRLYENTKVDGRDASMTFSHADADRFIAAFHARKAAMKT